VATPLSILLTGESGTGKELIARGVHDLSKRRGAFVAVSCASLPETLVESELFGHVKGAFSGAMKDRPGALLASSGGTLFLDEIGDAPMSVQVSLLRALESHRVKPVGSEGYRTADVTLGGIDTDGLSSKTMEAKTMPGLYFIGEAVDVTGWLGGYNFQWAWSSGWAAGQAL